MKKKICFIGLGNMGFPMAGWLSQNNYSVTVYNRTTSKSRNWCKKYKGIKQTTPALAAKDADFTILCVGNDQDVLSVVKGKNGVLSSIKKGSVLIDHTTTSAKLAIYLASECQKYGVSFLDAPVSGGQIGAENGKLIIMVGGKKEILQTAETVMTCYAKKITLMGSVGKGQLTKMVNQICIAGLIQGLAEAIYFGEKVGINLEKAMDILSQGAAQSWQMDHRAKTMIKGEFNFGFALDWMKKDLGFCLEEAKKNKIPLPITELVELYYTLLQKDGKGKYDTSALIENLRKSSIKK